MYTMQVYEEVSVCHDQTRLLPNSHPVAWGPLFVSAGDQISEQVA